MKKYFDIYILKNEEWKKYKEPDAYAIYMETQIENDKHRRIINLVPNLK